MLMFEIKYIVCFKHINKSFIKARTKRVSIIKHDTRAHNIFK